MQLALTQHQGSNKIKENRCWNDPGTKEARIEEMKQKVSKLRKWINLNSKEKNAPSVRKK